MNDNDDGKRRFARAVTFRPILLALSVRWSGSLSRLLFGGDQREN
jgi:hypothetical protein